MNSSKSSLFLMEILLTMLFFSIAGAVCLQLYVKAHLVDENTTEINHADEWAQNLAETYYGCRADTENIEAVYHDSCIGGSNDIVIAFDADWKQIPASDTSSSAVYAVCLDTLEPTACSFSAQMDNAEVRVCKLGTPVKNLSANSPQVLSQLDKNSRDIYSLSLKYYDNTRK